MAHHVACISTATFFTSQKKSRPAGLPRLYFTEKRARAFSPQSEGERARSRKWQMFRAAGTVTEEESLSFFRLLCRDDGAGLAPCQSKKKREPKTFVRRPNSMAWHSHLWLISPVRTKTALWLCLRGKACNVLFTLSLFSLRK